MSTTTKRVRYAPPPARLWLCRDLPLWARVGLYAVEHHGHPLQPGELRTLLGPATAVDISRAIARAVAAGLLAHDSSARCLYSLVKP